MGGCCGAEGRPGPVGHVHDCLFPMYLVKVSDFLAMRGAPLAHQELMRQGKLTPWRPGMRATRRHERQLDVDVEVTFISHQWLGQAHPDAQGRHAKASNRGSRCPFCGRFRPERARFSIQKVILQGVLGPVLAVNEPKVLRETLQGLLDGTLAVATEHGSQESLFYRSSSACRQVSRPVALEAACWWRWKWRGTRRASSRRSSTTLGSRS